MPPAVPLPPTLAIDAALANRFDECAKAWGHPHPGRLLNFAMQNFIHRHFYPPSAGGGGGGGEARAKPRAPSRTPHIALSAHAAEILEREMTRRKCTASTLVDLLLRDIEA